MSLMTVGACQVTQSGAAELSHAPNEAGVQDGQKALEVAKARDGRIASEQDEPCTILGRRQQRGGFQPNGQDILILGWHRQITHGAHALAAAPIMEQAITLLRCGNEYRRYAGVALRPDLAGMTRMSLRRRALRKQGQRAEHQQGQDPEHSLAPTGFPLAAAPQPRAQDEPYPSRAVVRSRRLISITFQDNAS